MKYCSTLGTVNLLHIRQYTCMVANHSYNHWIHYHISLLLVIFLQSLSTVKLDFGRAIFDAQACWSKDRTPHEFFQDQWIKFTPDAHSLSTVASICIGKNIDSMQGFNIKQTLHTSLPIYSAFAVRGGQEGTTEDQRHWIWRGWGWGKGH